MSEIPEPGSFYTEEPTPGSFYKSDETVTAQESQKETCTEISQDLVDDFNAFMETFRPETNFVYYPCCGPDATPSEVFKNRVLYLDGNKLCVDALKKAGHEALVDNATTFDPGNPDIVILYNPQISPESIAEKVKPSGFLICNNYHSTANAMSQNNNFEFVGAVQDGGVDQENLEDYWKKIETDEELDRADSYIADSIRETVLKTTGKTSDVIQTYRQILANNPIGLVRVGENTIPLWPLPAIKSSTTYIFRKKSNKQDNEY